jgi:hypothetical protein
MQFGSHFQRKQAFRSCSNSGCVCKWRNRKMQRCEHTKPQSYIIISSPHGVVQLRATKINAVDVRNRIGHGEEGDCTEVLQRRRLADTTSLSHLDDSAGIQLIARDFDRSSTDEMRQFFGDPSARESGGCVRSLRPR